MILKISKTRNSGLIRKEHSIFHFLPYEYHWNNNTILLTGNRLMKVIKMNGISFETMDDDDLDTRKNMRNQLFRGIANEKLGVYTHIVRRKITIDKASKHATNNYFIDFATKKINENQEMNQAYINDLYVTIIAMPQTAGTAAIENFIKKFSSGLDKNKWLKNLKEESEYLEEIASRIVQSTREYKPRVLGTVDTPYGPKSEIMQFLGLIINGCEDNNALLSPLPIAKYLATNRLYFGFKNVEIKMQTQTKYAGIISIKEYGQHTYAGMLDNFLQLPCELIVTQSYNFTNRQSAIMKMQIQQNRMIQTEDKAVSQIVEISKALDDAMSGRIAFGTHHLTVCCYASTSKAIENVSSMVEVALSNSGTYPVREKINMEPAFWGQLPGNFDFLVRKATISTANLAGLSSLHNFPHGKKDGNHWGDAVTVLNTTSGTPYYFNFHVRDVGHSMIIGPTGAGKTVLLNFLCAQTIKYNPRMFFFDKDRGGEIFIRAINGVYTVIESNSKNGFNPLQLDDTGENRTFLTDWLQKLVTAYTPELSTTDIASINDAITGNFKLKKEDRNLSNLVAFMGLDSPDTVAGRMAMWHGSGSHAGLFDNKEDSLNLKKADIFGFEMGSLLKDKIALGPALLYLFHRISISLDGRPTMIVLDEAWALIDNPVFAPKIKDWLKVLRKLNTFVIFATQSVEDASKSEISDTLIQQTATQIFLPNLKATAVYRQIFMLSQREFSLIKHTDPSSRFFLVKQEMHSVIAKLDLKGLDDIINVLSGRAETVIVLDKIRAEYGDNPKIWIPIFTRKVKEMNEEK